MTKNDEIRRQLSGMPTGEYRMADVRSAVSRREEIEEEPSTIPELLLALPSEK